MKERLFFLSEKHQYAQSILGVGGFLLTLFASRLPTQLQDVGLYTGIVLVAIAIIWVLVALILGRKTSSIANDRNHSLTNQVISDSVNKIRPQTQPILTKDTTTNVAYYSNEKGAPSGSTTIKIHPIGMEEFCRLCIKEMTLRERLEFQKEWNGRRILWQGWVQNVSHDYKKVSVLVTYRKELTGIKLQEFIHAHFSDESLGDLWEVKKESQILFEGVLNISADSVINISVSGCEIKRIN